MTEKESEPCILDPANYPPLLDQIEKKPNRLWIWGRPAWSTPPKDTKFLCVVGSRNHTRYASDVMRRLFSELVGLPIIIVSGIALGIDSLAHHLAIEYGLKTIAIPGSGLGRHIIYPRQNFSLAARIISENHGCLLSPFSPHEKARPFFFPVRNQLMASISHAVLVIECRKDSGTMITARLAVEMNRDLLVVPGSIIGTEREGSNSLFKNGAYPILSGKDLVEALGFSYEEKIKEETASLSQEEQKILSLLESPANRSTISLHAQDIPFQHLLILLSTLEAKGLIRESMGMFRKI